MPCYASPVTNHSQGSSAASGARGQGSVEGERGLAVVEQVVGRSRYVLAKSFDLVFVGERKLGADSHGERGGRDWERMS